MVFPGSVLHAQTNSQPRLALRGRIARPRWVRPASPGMGRAALLGYHQARWLQPRPPRHGSGHLPGLLSLHLHSAGIFHMRALAILFLLWFAPGAAPAADPGGPSHAPVDAAPKAPAALIKNDVHIAH